MAYNREWDRGKHFPNEGPSWQQHPRSNVHLRDDDYPNDGKRRKHNDGGYETSQGYDDSGYDASFGQGRQTDYAQDYPDDRHQRGGPHGKKRLVPSDPSPHVIFLGLDPDFTEADLQAYLTSNSYPPPASHGATATTAFYKALEAGSPAPPGGRRVKIDYSQSASPSDKRLRGPQHANDGTRDIGNTQAPVLLFRGLDPLSGTQAIAQAMKTCAGLGKEGARGMRRIILIKDKLTMASWGFAFVELVCVRCTRSNDAPQLHPSGFRISDRPVAASFAHPYSFQPVPDYSLRDEACLMSSSTLGGVENVWVRYWDEGSSVAVLEFQVEELPQPAPEPAREKKEKKKSKVESDATPLSVDEHSVEASILPVSDKPVTLSLKGGATTKQGLSSISANVMKKATPISLAFSMTEESQLTDIGAHDGEDGNDALASADSSVIVAKKVAPLIASKRIANNINKWNQVQEGLSHETPATPTTILPPSTTSSTQATKLPVTAVSSGLGPGEAEFEFSDIVAMTCLLCARQFKSREQLKRHNNESELHKVKNHQDASLCDVAREKAKAARAKIDQPKYRDRASERRVMHNQPDVPRPSESNRGTGKRRFAEGPPPASTPLLLLISVRTTIIQTAIYAQGAGLGASKGKEIGKYADGYAGYVNMAQDAARERYGN
ncbi:hypothetical protein A0H81_04710 [Grifola frondosa]|uniref:C2H2-type domain-containing protein n=1 Tax=Grifola frondosa TaxID=5627 RepID=A0A1C7MGX8_GRIFR|nr:hypothetical protein A0H81_04710 [Grifola frondosa]